MQPVLRIVAVLLLAALAASVAWAFVPPAAQITHLAGCHSHAPVPVPAPASHQCCIVGHNQAIPANLFSDQASLACFGTSEIAEPAASAQRFNGGVSLLISPPLGPPGSLCLRV